MTRLLLPILLLLVLAATAQAQPVVVATPEVAGAARVGATLTAAPVQLEGAEPADVELRWERSLPVGGWEPIAGAHASTYVPAVEDVGRFLRVRVVVETPEGTDGVASEPVGPVRRSGPSAGPLRIGPDPDATGAGDPDVRLGRWVVTAGQGIALHGRVGAADPEAAHALVLEPTVPSLPVVRAPLAVDGDGRLQGLVRPRVNAIAWLELDGDPARRLRLGVVGVRPRIVARLAARPDGRDASGRPLVRDLRLLPGSAVAPAVGGLRLRWEGILPGERAGTAVCRADEAVVSDAHGRLAGGCRTRGAWAAARWRLVHDPGTDDPGAAAFLAARGPWLRPVLRGAAPEAPAIPVLPRACATLRAWNSAPSRSSSRPPCRAATPRSRTSWAPAATTSPSASRPSSSPGAR